MTLREAIEKAEHELEDYRRRGDNSKLHEILAALDPDSEVGNPNVDSVINTLARMLSHTLSEVETRQGMTVEVIARIFYARGLWTGRRVEQLLEAKHPNGQEGLRK
jgi:hypothetical protein